ncbi:hypothetical protein [Croceicoccus sp. Ery5]|uniref:hypothetical protein n=1 Tax=Croceicoccus sp. Ery5 TaxID=1703340 RepID=UPI001E5721F1|nr:hypothetical protein [Croceicoccus sp. Ery5]
MSSPVETKPKRNPAWKRRLWQAVPVAVLTGFAAAAFVWGPGMAAEARAGTDFGARIACSCHYVAGRPIDQCRADFEPGMTMVRLSVDEEAQEVTASVPMLASTRARYREGWGCVLEQWSG